MGDELSRRGRRPRSENNIAAKSCYTVGMRSNTTLPSSTRISGKSPISTHRFRCNFRASQDGPRRTPQGLPQFWFSCPRREVFGGARFWWDSLFPQGRGIPGSFDFYFHLQLTVIEGEPGLHGLDDGFDIAPGLPLLFEFTHQVQKQVLKLFLLHRYKFLR